MKSHRDRPLQIAVFVSGSGGNLQAVMRLASCRPDLASVSVVVTDRPGCRAVSIAEEAGIPVIAKDFRAECGRASDCRTPRERTAYRRRAEVFHDGIDEELVRFERSSVAIDLVVLSYGRWIHGHLLDRFAGRMINQHPGDLTLLGTSGNRILVGNDPVLTALRLGVPQVRTSTFFVDAGPDAGPIICQGPTVEATGVLATRWSADVLEQTMKRESDWPSVICAITLLAEDAICVDQDRRMEDNSHGVSIGGVRMDFGGLRLMADLDNPDPELRQICETVSESIARCSAGRA
ncbi:MAG: phosphoribosylglycinamide formyltransferase [Solirubrobacterales bacterium]